VTRLLITWLANCLGLLIAAAIVPEISYGHKLGTLLLAGAVLGVVNFLVRPLVILLTLPAVILTLGLFLLVINALMLWVTSKLVGGFEIGGFFSTLAAALIVWVVNMVLRPWRRWQWRSDGDEHADRATRVWFTRR
jgi:putative membrane protein